MTIESQLLISIDPGSSAKGCAVWRHRSDPGGERARYEPKAKLGSLVEEACAHAKSAPVVIGIDAPLRAYGGIQRPALLDLEAKKTWPFDANPYSQRPCEKALTSRFDPANDLGAALIARARGRRAMNPWKAGHPGVSVLGYMSAPHAPIVGTFLDRLRKSAKAAKLHVTFCPTRSLSRGTIHVVETHPAVALGFYAQYGALGERHSIAKYKGSPGKGETAESLRGVVRALMREMRRILPVEAQGADDSSPDCLDALVGLANLVDLAKGEADVFGTCATGYFLIPRRHAKSPTFGPIWAALSEPHGFGRPSDCACAAPNPSP